MFFLSTFNNLNHYYLVSAKSDDVTTFLWIFISSAIVIGILLFFLGLYLIITGVRENNPWKSIFGILLTGIWIGLVVWIIAFLLNKNSTSPAQKIPSASRAHPRKKTSTRKKIAKS